MIEFLAELDSRLFLFLNGAHSDFLDIWMFRFTNKVFWIPLYLFIAGFLIAKYKLEGLWLVLTAIALISLSDLLVSGFMKPFFERLRPSRDPDMAGLVHIVNEYRGGNFSFASGHAATSFCLATFFWLSTRAVSKWSWLIFLWAALFSYTRIYLGVHYPGDILVGGILGSLIAWLGYRLFSITKVMVKARST